MGCPETSVRNYHYSLRNNREERSSQLRRGGRLKSGLLETVTLWVIIFQLQMIIIGSIVRGRPGQVDNLIVSKYLKIAH